MDCKPFVNIPPFGDVHVAGQSGGRRRHRRRPGRADARCRARPVTTPWKPGSPTVLVANVPALNNSSTCQCAFGGVITITSPGQFTATVP